MNISLTKLIERYQHLSSPVVYDILDTMGYPNQALSSKIQPLAPDMVLVGPAYTIDGQTDGPEVKTSLSSFQVFREIIPDSIIVKATNGHSASGPWGENTSITAQMRGARGIILDGGTRDANAIVEIGFPTFCRYVTPVFSRGRFRLTSYQQPIQVAGQVAEIVTVNPGDFVIGDRDGVVIIPQTIIEEVLVAAEQLEEIEGQLRAGLRAGEDREVVYKRYPKFDHVEQIKSGI